MNCIEKSSLDKLNLKGNKWMNEISFKLSIEYSIEYDGCICGKFGP